MCKDHEHTFRTTVTVSYDGKRQPTVRYILIEATGMAIAVAKADHWATTTFPDANLIEISCWHIAYPSIESAIEHSALDPASAQRVVFITTERLGELERLEQRIKNQELFHAIDEHKT